MCQTVHSTGLGQTYFSCNATGAHSQTDAEAAAQAWAPAGTAGVPDCGFPCIGRISGASCAVWCPTGSNLAGLVGLNPLSAVCLCPSAGNPLCPVSGTPSGNCYSIWN